jgi:AraC-like DNA-binding protein
LHHLDDQKRAAVRRIADTLPPGEYLNTLHAVALALAAQTTPSLAPQEKTPLWHTVLVAIVRQHASRTDFDPASLTRRASHIVQRLWDLDKYEPTRIETIAYEIDLSISAVRKWFRVQIGLSPKCVHEFFICHRVLADLANPKLKINKIAEFRGFSDPAGFSRFFRNTMGFSAAHYRKNILRL